MAIRFAGGMVRWTGVRIILDRMNCSTPMDSRQAEEKQQKYNFFQM